MDLLPLSAAETLRAWWGRPRRVYLPATVKGWRGDWAILKACCEPRGLAPLPATSETVAGFVLRCPAANKEPETVRMPMRHGDKAMAALDSMALDSMARAAEAQGREL